MIFSKPSLRALVQTVHAFVIPMVEAIPFERIPSAKLADVWEIDGSKLIELLSYPEAGESAKHMASMFEAGHRYTVSSYAIERWIKERTGAQTPKTGTKK